MAATAASQIIFFIAAIVISVAVVGSLISTTHNFSNDIKSRGNDMGKTIQTHIAIINDPVAMPYNATNKTIAFYVMNTGSTILPYSNSSVIVMINGTSFSNLSFVLPSGVKTWGPDVTLTIYVHDVILPKQDYRLLIVVHGGVTEELNFRIS
jgi:archaellum component FlaG (FlaF/FlaG flagellin family)